MRKVRLQMAQLVKLQDYISRYETDLTRYPTQFVRLKQNQWKRMKIQWETNSNHSMWEDDLHDIEPEEKNQFAAIFRFFSPRKEEGNLVEAPIKISEEDEVFDFTTTMTYKPANLKQLRKLYMDQIFHFQLKWASSTLMDKSRVNPKYMRDSLLRTIIQELPDSYLLFYNPIIMLQKATVELDIIIITPVECMCITVLEEEDLTAFAGSKERFWTTKLGENESKVLNPLMALNRMEKIVSRLFGEKDIDFPIKKYLLSRNGYIDYPVRPFDVEIVDRRSYDEWFSSLGMLSAPLKFAQFQAAQAILDVGQTNAISQLFDGEEGKVQL